MDENPYQPPKAEREPPPLDSDHEPLSGREIVLLLGPFGAIFIYIIYSVLR